MHSPHTTTNVFLLRNVICLNLGISTYFFPIFCASAICPCAASPEDLPNMRPTQLAYHDLLKELIDSGRYDTRDDFTVVLQPHMRDFLPPKDVSGRLT